MSRQEEIITKLIEYTGPLGPFVSLEEFENNKQQWYEELDSDDIDILLSLLAEGPSQARFDPQCIEEAGTIAAEAISVFSNKTGIDVLTRISSRLSEFTNLLYVIELLGRLKDPNAITVLLQLSRTRKLRRDEMVSLVWSIGETGNPDATKVLREMKQNLSDDPDLRETIDTVLVEIEQGRWL